MPQSSSASSKWSPRTKRDNLSFNEPSTSSVEDPSTSAEEPSELRSNLIARLLAKIRDVRDERETLCFDVKKEDECPKELSHPTERIAPLNDHILQLETRTSGVLLEDLLKNPSYASLAIKMEAEALSSKELAPIEVKIEDVASSSASTNVTSGSQSVFDGNQETNVEKAAKREAHVMAKIAELRRTGMWTNSRLPMCVEPARNKTHWDYLLEEVRWMATDFRQERSFKRNAAKKLATAINRQQRDKQIEQEKAEQRVVKEGKRICASIAKMIRDFWQNVDKVVDFRAQEILESKKRKALDKHLAFIVGEADKLSSMVQEGLIAEKSSKTPSIASDPADKDDAEFSGDESETDDESTIAKAELSVRGEEVRNEVAALEDEANQDIDDFLASLPEGYLASLGIQPSSIKNREETPNHKEIGESSAGSSAEKNFEHLNDDKKMDKSEVCEVSSTSASIDEASEQNQDHAALDGNGDSRGVLEQVDYAKLNSEDSDERQKELANIAEEALKFQPKGYTLETTQVKTTTPFLIRGILREYQMVGLDWLVTLYEKNLNGILADEMGLGKTIQTISLLAHLACSESIWGPHLIVVPTSVILNWEMEFKKWCPALKILTYFGSLKDRQEKRKGWSKQNSFHVCITSYKTVIADIRAFKKKAWQYLILDEAQNIKNWKSQRWQALLNMRARRRLLLTGTPLQNSLMELWSLMHFLMPAIFASHDDFKDWFSNPLTGMMEGSVEFNAPLVQRLHKVLRPFILRRLKCEVEKQLPEKTEHVIKCSLSKRQRYLYDDFMSKRETRENLKSGNMMSVLNIVMQLRKCCNHPNLFEPRPVVSPLVLNKQTLHLPGFLFDIADSDPAKDQIIPHIFDLRSRLGGWQTQVSSRRPLVEEVGNIVEVLRPPTVEGFRFCRTNFDARFSNSLAATKTRRSADSPSEEESKSNTEPINGHTISEYLAAIDDSGENPATPVSAQGQPFAKPPQRPVCSSLRAKTVLNPAPLSISTDSRGFHYNMTNGGTHPTRSYADARFSPPLKRPKRTDKFEAYVPVKFNDRMNSMKRNHRVVVLRRFDSIKRPILCNELISLLRLDNSKGGMCERDEIKVSLNGSTDLLLDRFSMYSENVVSDALDCRASSLGRPVPGLVRQNKVEEAAKTVLSQMPSTFDKISLSRVVQFPELRLIEYDCGKLQILSNLLRQLFLYKHRCLIFTQMSRMLDVLQAFLSYHGYQYFRLDGTTGIEQRQAMMERFNADPKIFCFILSTRSGGVGVNLTGADTVIFYDSDWNPTMDAQAQDRCHRIGQTRNVAIYRLISEKTIEENILKKAAQKKKLGEMAIDEAGFTPSFFKQSDNIRDLFDGEEVEVEAPADAPRDQKDLEKVLAKLEDDVDVVATKNATAEARVDKAEFEESAKLPVSHLSSDEPLDEKYMDLIGQLKPIERYAISFLEEEYRPEFEEEVKEAEALIDQKKEDWVRAHEHAMSENAEDVGDDFYLGGSLLDEVRKRRSGGSNATYPSRKIQTVPTRHSTRQVILRNSLRSPNRRRVPPSSSFTPLRSPVRSAAQLAAAGLVRRSKGITPTAGRSVSQPSSAPDSSKRGRGRPRKIIKESKQFTPEVSSASSAESSKRKDVTEPPTTDTVPPKITIVKARASLATAITSVPTTSTLTSPSSRLSSTTPTQKPTVAQNPVFPVRTIRSVVPPQARIVRISNFVAPASIQRTSSEISPTRIVTQRHIVTSAPVRRIGPSGEQRTFYAYPARGQSNMRPVFPVRVISSQRVALQQPNHQQNMQAYADNIGQRPGLGDYERPRLSYRRPDAEPET
ncbi:unnamed protein product [Caenorhabditis auriculariae]|uniref:Uncharacterized protein n=1 Tax=Caenorhabditis auriculariae TaxID=2777116 RepID=A0A8S1GZP8_9PELO|nr:unnamed protein product [Caenorhabditis auriculariae]